MSASTHPVSLEVYAWATAALADGFDERAVLEKAGLDGPRWREARAHWLARLGEAGAAAPVFKEYEALLAHAEDAFARPVVPLDTDLATWLTFLDGVSRARDAGAFLASLGLRASDSARLARAWAKRLEADPKLSRTIAELRKGGLPPHLPRLHVGVSSLGPGPHATPPAPEPRGAPPPAPSAPPQPAERELLLDRYATIRAELDAGIRLDRALWSEDIDAETFAAHDARYRAAMETDRALAADFRSLYEHAKERRKHRGR